MSRSNCLRQAFMNSRDNLTSCPGAPLASPGVFSSCFATGACLGASLLAAEAGPVEAALWPVDASAALGAARVEVDAATRCCALARAADETRLGGGCAGFTAEGCLGDDDAAAALDMVLETTNERAPPSAIQAAGVVLGAGSGVSDDAGAGGGCELVEAVESGFAAVNVVLETGPTGFVAAGAASSATSAILATTGSAASTTDDVAAPGTGNTACFEAVLVAPCFACTSAAVAGGVARVTGVVCRPAGVVRFSDSTAATGATSGCCS